MLGLKLIHYKAADFFRLCSKDVGNVPLRFKFAVKIETYQRKKQRI